MLSDKPRDEEFTELVLLNWRELSLNIESLSNVEEDIFGLVRGSRIRIKVGGREFGEG